MKFKKKYNEPKILLGVLLFKICCLFMNNLNKNICIYIKFKIMNEFMRRASKQAIS